MSFDRYIRPEDMPADAKAVQSEACRSLQEMIEEGARPGDLVVLLDPGRYRSLARGCTPPDSCSGELRLWVAGMGSVSAPVMMTRAYPEGICVAACAGDLLPTVAGVVIRG